MKVTRQLLVIDGNCSWIRSLVGALPDNWDVRLFSIYNPQWVPGGWKGMLDAFRWKRHSARVQEMLVIVPGWRKAPSTSLKILRACTYPILRRSDPVTSVLFSFPFYSQLASRIRREFPGVQLCYHAHDPFEFYNFPPGYIAPHEKNMIQACDLTFAISDQLIVDFKERYSESRFQWLGNAVSRSFLEKSLLLCSGGVSVLHDVKRPIVGCVGQINSSYDWDLIESLATKCPNMTFVFVGNLFEEGEVTARIRRIFAMHNVLWTGPVCHEKLPAYLASFDVCLNPLQVNEQNERRDPLRLYDYMTTQKPIISTDVSAVKRHSPLVETARGVEEMIDLLLKVTQRSYAVDVEARARYISKNTWEDRAGELADALI